MKISQKLLCCFLSLKEKFGFNFSTINFSAILDWGLQPWTLVENLLVLPCIIALEIFRLRFETYCKSVSKNLCSRKMIEIGYNTQNVFTERDQQFLFIATNFIF